MPALAPPVAAIIGIVFFVSTLFHPVLPGQNQNEFNPTKLGAPLQKGQGT